MWQAIGELILEANQDVLAWGKARRCEGEIQGGMVFLWNEVHAYKTRASHARNQVPHTCATLSYSWVIVKLTCCHVYRCLPALPEDDTSSVVSVCGSEIMGYTFTWRRNDRYKTKRKYHCQKNREWHKNIFCCGRDPGFVNVRGGAGGTDRRLFPVLAQWLWNGDFGQCWPLQTTDRKHYK